LKWHYEFHLKKAFYGMVHEELWPMRFSFFEIKMRGLFFVVLGGPDLEC
jgi:hypothetical protein